MYIYTQTPIHNLFLILQNSVMFRNLMVVRKQRHFGIDIQIHNSANFLLHFGTTGLMPLPNVYFLIEIP